MRPTEYPPRRRGTRDSGTAPLGPAMTTLRSVIARLASVVRGAGIVYIVVQVAIWPSFYAAGPWRLAAAADAALAEADRAAAGQYAILSRTVERREQERLLHDTVLNTLTALARAGPGETGDVAGAVSRARQDVALIEAALSDPDP